MNNLIDPPKHNLNHDELKRKHGILNWFIDNPVTANIMMILTVFIGLYTVGFLGLFDGLSSSLRLEAFPDTPPDRVTITASISGSTPEDVERGVTSKIEEAIKGVSGIDETTSISTASTAVITVIAKEGYDLDKLTNDLKTQTDAVTSLPAELENITVAQEDRPERLIWISLYGDISDKKLITVSRELRDALLRNPNIDTINLRGERDYEISIEVDEKSLRKYDLTFDEIASAIDNSSLNLAAGSIDSSQGEITLRIKNQAYVQKDFDSIVVRTNKNGSQVKLTDVAKIIDGFTDQQVLSLMNGEPSITLEVQSEGESNVLNTVREAKKIVNEFSQSNLPADVYYKIWNDKTIPVQDRIRVFKDNGIQGMILVVLLLTLFLNFRLAIFVAIGIPISFCGALILMKIMGLSINLITLFGFILVLGIVVDDAIVIGESIFTAKKRFRNQAGATLYGAGRVSTAATFGVLTTIAAFLPLTQISGKLGDILGQMAYVVIFCLIFSLIESKLILPAHLKHIRVSSKEETSNWFQKIQVGISHGLENLVEKFYQPVLAKSLTHRYFTILLFVSMFILILGLITSGVVKIRLQPSIESEYITLSVEMEPTVSVDVTQGYALKASKALIATKDELTKKYNLEYDLLPEIYARSREDTRFVISASLASGDLREIDAQEITALWRDKVGEIEGAKSVNFNSSFRFSTNDIEIQLLSNDLDSIILASEKIQEKLSEFNGVEDISSNLKEGAPEILISLKPEAETYGINRAELASVVRAAFYGKEAQRVQRGEDEVKVMVRYPKKDRKNLSDLYNLRVRTDSGLSIPLSSIANLNFSTGYSEINHYNSQKTITVIANVNKDLISSNEVLSELSRSGFFDQIEQEFNLSVVQGGEAKENAKSNTTMELGFISSLIMIYILLAIPLKSYAEPIIIMSAIPFGIIGAILGHLLLGMSISILSFFGILALSGVVVNDALVFVSSVKQYRIEGMGLDEALSTTGIRRFRPIILTSLTTFIGLVPLLFESSIQAQFLIPMAVSLGFGILFATILTLFLIPALFYMVDDLKNLISKKENHI